MRISQTTVSLFHQCKHKFRLAVIDNVVPRFTPRPMARGTLIHLGFSTAWTTGSIIAAVDAIVDRQYETLDSPDLAPFLTPEMREEGMKFAHDAAKIFERGWLALKPDKWEVMALPDGTPLVELEMTADNVQGTLDFALRNRETGRAWLFDLKCPGRLAAPDWYELHFQAPVYARLLADRYGIEIHGNAIYQVKAVVPEAPTINKTLKDGKRAMSRTAARCDWSTYRQTLLSHGMDPADYADVQAKLIDFDRLDYYPLSQDFRDRVWQEFQAAAREVVEYTGSYPRNLHPMHCNMCQYKAHCKADLQGFDMGFMESTLFMRDGQTPEGEPFRVFDEWDGEL